MFDAGPLLHLLVGAADDGLASQRRAPRHHDEALTGTTRAWLRQLPSSRRPLRLCMRFPGVANRIAWCWREMPLARQALDDLLVDKRGGRMGFPRAVYLELLRLRDFVDDPRAERGPTGGWARLRAFWSRT